MGKVSQFLSDFALLILQVDCSFSSQKKTEVLLSSLVAKKVASKRSLMEVWASDDPKCKLSEICGTWLWCYFVSNSSTVCGVYAASFM